MRLFTRRRRRLSPGRGRRPRRRAPLQPPLTPMIDVTFLLLMFFLLATEFRQAEGQIPGSLPAKGDPRPAAAERIKRPIRVLLRPRPAAEGGVACVYELAATGTTAAGPAELHAELTARRERFGDLPVIIEPRPHVPWRCVVEAFNAAVRARFEHVTFAPAGGGEEEQP